MAVKVDEHVAGEVREEDVSVTLDLFIGCPDATRENLGWAVRA